MNLICYFKKDDKKEKTNEKKAIEAAPKSRPRTILGAMRDYITSGRKPAGVQVDMEEDDNELEAVKQGEATEGNERSKEGGKPKEKKDTP